jgi:hypothetical protein
LLGNVSDSISNYKTVRPSSKERKEIKVRFTIFIMDFHHERGALARCVHTASKKPVVMKSRHTNYIYRSPITFWDLKDPDDDV